MSNYVISKKKVEVGDRGFIIGDRFIHLQNNGLKIPEKGLVFYAPLSDDVVIANNTIHNIGIAILYGHMVIVAV